MFRQVLHTLYSMYIVRMYTSATPVGCTESPHLVYFNSSRKFQTCHLVYFRLAPIGGRSPEETNMFPAAHAQHRPSSFFIEDILLGRTKAAAGPVHRPSPGGLSTMTQSFGRPTYPIVSASAATAAFNFEALFPSPLQFQPFALPSFGPKMGDHPFLLPTNSGESHVGPIYSIRVTQVKYRSCTDNKISSYHLSLCVTCSICTLHKFTFSAVNFKEYAYYRCSNRNLPIYSCTSNICRKLYNSLH